MDDDNIRQSVLFSDLGIKPVVAKFDQEAWACIRCQLCRFQNFAIDLTRLFADQHRGIFRKTHPNKINMIGSGRFPIRHFRHQLHAQANTAYLSRETVRLLTIWLETAHIKEGALFRRLVGKRRIGERLNVDAVAQAFKRVAAFIGMTPKEIEQISGHSIRVGATQDLLALNIDLASVMQAGRWKTNRMPMRYGENVLVARGGMARAAEAQGRDS